MTKQASRTALFLSTTTNYIKDIVNYITAAFHVQSQEDLYDTLAPEYATVANKATLDALVLGTNFKEQDYRFVTNDEDEDGLLSLYRYTKNTSGAYGWLLMWTVRDNGNWLSVANETLFNTYVLGTDFYNGDWCEIVENDAGNREVKKYISGSWRTISETAITSYT